MREIKKAARSRDARTTPREGRYREMIAEWERGSETIAGVAARHGIAAATLKWWRVELKRRDRARASAAPVAATLLPVRVTTPWPPTTPAVRVVFEVALIEGRRVLRIPSGFDPADVRALVEAVEGGAC